MIQGARILYIEDDQDLAVLLRAALGEHGHLVEIAGTGSAGLAAFDEALHDLVIVDYHLPDQDGLQVLEQIVGRGAVVPVIIVTAAGSEEVAVRAMKLGAADYITKETADRFFRLLPPLIEKTLRQHEIALQKQRAEDELRRSEERLRSILASIDDAVLVTDGSGFFVAARAPGPGGATAAAGLIGATFRDAFPAAAAGKFEQAFSAVQASKRVEQFDYSLPVDGTELWFNAKMSPLVYPGRGFSGVTIVARDITERKRAEDQLRLASLAADAASRAKSDLLAGMSHELRTPLTAIIGYTEILLYEYFGPVNERQKQQLETVLECSRHLLELINDILDISKIESGKTELELRGVRVGSLIVHAVRLLRETAQRRSISVQTRVAEELSDVVVEADERRLMQVLFNLISNALKFTPAGGSVEVSLLRQDGDLAVSVSDTGIGLAPEELERIFESFYQVRGRQPVSYAEGSGLGLSLARQIVELHGGRIWAESGGEGTGCRVSFTLPLHARPVTPGASPG